jgi:predicted transposase YdaD
MSQREIDQMLGISLEETRVYREAKEEGRTLEARSLILLLLTHRFGELPQEMRDRVESLPLATLENLGKALLDFDGLTDLQAWLESVAEPESEEAS